MKQLFLSAIIALGVVSCNTSTHSTKPNSHTEMAQDIHSSARFSDAQVTHLHLNLNVDFDQKQLSGKAILDLDITNKIEEPTLVLDIRDLSISAILNKNGDSLKYAIEKLDDYLGQKLAIQLNDADQVTIHYSTSPSAPALQWLSPEQTAGKKLPVLFSQSQAILARSWVPIQDSPGIRFTYSANITCPSTHMALMSANNPTAKSADGSYSFKMEQPIPAYLLALVVADYDFVDLGGNTGVYAEPATIELASSELEDLPNMVTAAANLYGDYAWDRYDVAFMPPAFPFGGMENPRITFATPTILAGDKSLVSLIAHELAHSWSGNLVTNASWNDFWLNEGFTVYFELRIMEAIYGKDMAEMLRVLSVADLKSQIAEISAGRHPEDTKLKLNLEGRDPDEGLTAIAYDKGALLLWNIEQRYGREAFDKFLTTYFKEFSFQVMDTKKFLAIISDRLLNTDEQKKAELNIDTWVFGEGIPENALLPTSNAFEAVDNAFAQFATSKDAKALHNTANTDDWSVQEWQHFLAQVSEKGNKGHLEALQLEYDFLSTGNSEIAFLFLQASIIHGYSAAYPRLTEFLSTVGRRKFIFPLYETWVNTNSQEFSKSDAEKVYQGNRPSYHFVTYQSCDQLFNN